MTFDAQRLSFGGIADHYDRARPPYPQDAVAWAIGPGTKRVLDLGAGTGKLTRAVLALGHDVIAVEPDPGMRETFRTSLGREALAGSAEEIPLPDANVDAVVVGQAYHWFDRDRAHPEIARVLRPGGTFAPMWNQRDTSVDWTRRLDEIMTANQRENTPADTFGPWFGPIEERHFRHATRQTRQGIADLVTSRSYYIVATPEEKAELMRQIRELTDTLPEEGFDLPYTTRVRRCVRKPA